MPAGKALEPGVLNRTCTRGSVATTGNTSNSRVAAVTLCTTARTVRCTGIVRHSGNNDRRGGRAADRAADRLLTDTDSRCMRAPVVIHLSVRHRPP